MKYISMNAEMTKAILDRRKTQARVVIKSDVLIQLNKEYKYHIRDKKFRWNDFKTLQNFLDYSSKYKKNETIWVREPVEIVDFIDTDAYSELSFKYIADNELNLINSDNTEEYTLIDFYEEKLYGKKWVKSGARIPIGCFKEMARIFLNITNIRVERLQDINGVSIENEGAIHQTTNKILVLEQKLRLENIDWYKNLWDKTAPKGYKWNDNPYVFVYEFKVLDNKEIK